MSIVKVTCTHPRVNIKKYRFDTSKVKPYWSFLSAMAGEDGTYKTWSDEELINRVNEIYHQIFPMYGDRLSRQRAINYFAELERRRLWYFEDVRDTYELEWTWE